MLIIGKSGIPMLKKGYPTVSDKYNVAGATLAGNTPIEFGQLVKYSDANPGYYEAITAQVTVDKIAGFVLATNVKLQEWNSEKVYTYPSEAFNLLVNGFMAIEVKSDATLANIKANAKVYVDLTNGTLTTSDKTSVTIVELPNVVYTGVYEKHGDTILAEILVK